MQFASQKGGNIDRFDRLNKGFQETRVKSFQDVLLLEDLIGRILGLHYAPVVAQVHFINQRAVLAGKTVQFGMQLHNIELSG